MTEDLKLAVQSLELGSLTTNAKKIKESVERKLENDYKTENYSEDNIGKAKTDKALLNKTSKTLNDERIRLEKEFMKPFNEFKDIVNETNALIKVASDNIDNIVKEVEEKAKDKRHNIIKEIYEKEIGELKDLISLDKILDNKWLNKGSFNANNEFKKEEELVEKINVIGEEIKIIKDLNSENELTLINIYLKNLDLKEVLKEDNTLKELKLKQTNDIDISTTESEITGLVRTYTLTITATQEQYNELEEYLIEKGMVAIK